jgi:hypothetical protein
MATTQQQHAIFPVILALAGASGTASGTGGGNPCIESLEGTGATSVLRAVGQGNFSCSNMSPGPDGGPMQPINGSVNVVIKNDAGIPGSTGTQVDIEVPSHLPGREIDAVFIRTQGSGGRCVYSFSSYSESAKGLRIGGGHFKASDVTVCADGKGTPPPEVIEPISTATDACEWEVSTSSGELGNLDVVSGVSRDGQTVAVCSAAGSTQFQCVDECKNFQPRGDSQACSDASTGLTSGQRDLEACRPCDLADPQSPPAVDKDNMPLFYCWEYSSSVVRYEEDELDPEVYPNAPGTGNIPGTEESRTPGTMLPHPSIGGTTFEVQSYNPCTTTTTRVNGRQYTYTTCR